MAMSQEMYKKENISREMYADRKLAGNTAIQTQGNTMTGLSRVHS